MAIQFKSFSEKRGFQQETLPTGSDGLSRKSRPGVVGVQRSAPRLRPGWSPAPGPPETLFVGQQNKTMGAPALPLSQLRPRPPGVGAGPCPSSALSGSFTAAGKPPGSSVLRALLVGGGGAGRAAQSPGPVSAGADTSVRSFLFCGFREPGCLLSWAVGVEGRARATPVLSGTSRPPGCNWSHSQGGGVTR